MLFGCIPVWTSTAELRPLEDLAGAPRPAGAAAGSAAGPYRTDPSAPGQAGSAQMPAAARRARARRLLRARVDADARRAARAAGGGKGGGGGTGGGGAAGTAGATAGGKGGGAKGGGVGGSKDICSGGGARRRPPLPARAKSGPGHGADFVPPSLHGAVLARAADEASAAGWSWDLCSVAVDLHELPVLHQLLDSYSQAEVRAMRARLAGVWERLLYSSLYPDTPPYAEMGARPRLDALHSLALLLRRRALAGAHPTGAGAIADARSGVARRRAQSGWPTTPKARPKKRWPPPASLLRAAG